MKHLCPALLGLLACHSPALADPAAVKNVTASRTGNGWSFSVTIRHGDTGWGDYANGWRIEDTSGTVIATRELLHPHVEEQPFTRSLGGVLLPQGIETIHVRVSTSLEGWASETTAVDIPRQ